MRVLAGLACVALAAGCERGAETAAVVPEETPAPLPLTSLAGRPAAEAKPAGVLPAFRAFGPESGLDFVRHDDFQGQWRLLEVNGGGVGLFDFDRDGRLDVFLTNGCRMPLSLGDREHRGQLFRNRGAFRFESVTDGSALAQFGYTYGCGVGDYDADGFDDLYVVGFGRDGFWRNNGDGTFTDVTDETGTAVPQWGSSAAFGDLDGDGDLDLYVTNYIDDSDESPRLCPQPASPDGYISCSPAEYEGVDDAVFLSDGAGGFVDATASAGVAGLKGKGLGVVVSDLDLDGRPEVYVANDGEANFLFVRRGSRDERPE
ncbi:MAG TPA: VCBS repeat-containing protein, partial [Planctomycetaceae bacterium]